MWTKTRMYNNVSFQQIDIQDINFPDETFDVIIANHMLYHIPDLQKALYEVKRVLKTG
ncbi:class I SAM-dependent methyltransferase [Clostridium nigeriense]|uniref:class I SAM-dependent methyltransferase n=1 Tax=uncultured Clostridium sp. TaxID=59620 RepID=UPI000A01BE4B|nr:class I SAM-dependent methyltransferase [Clostridium nigeriense]